MHEDRRLIGVEGGKLRVNKHDAPAFYHGVRACVLMRNVNFDGKLLIDRQLAALNLQSVQQLRNEGFVVVEK